MHSVRVGLLEKSLNIAPPRRMLSEEFTELPVNVQPTKTGLLPSSLCMPPPDSPAVLPVKTQSMSVGLPP